MNPAKRRDERRDGSVEAQLTALDDDDAIRCIVLTGAGTKAFCTGGDQSAHEGSYDGKGTVGLPMEALHNIIRSVPQPVIAKVRGPAYGMGVNMALACDFVIAADDDPSLPPDPHSQTIAAGIADARYVCIEDAAHLANVQQPVAVTRLILEHLEQP